MVEAVERRVRPAPDHPVLVVRPRAPGGTPTLLVSDLHLGIGATDRSSPSPPEGSAGRILAELLDVASDTRAGRLVVVGDVKHPVAGTPGWLRRELFDLFGELLSAGLEVEVVLGNHDGDLRRFLPKEVEVHSAGGAVVDGVGCFHGHRWPGDAVLASRLLVAGHLHPGVRLAPTPDLPSGKRRCWLWTRFPVEPGARRKRPASRRFRARAMVVLPPFNPIAGVEALNKGLPARYRSFLIDRFLVHGTTRAVLLDGTDLGELTWPPATSRPREGAGRSATRR